MRQYFENSYNNGVDAVVKSLKARITIQTARLTWSTLRQAQVVFSGSSSISRGDVAIRF